MKPQHTSVDASNWASAVSAGAESFARLSVAVRKEIGTAAGAITALKRAMHDITRHSVAEECASCGGACCRTGKYHFTIGDLLVHLSLDVPLPGPSFGGNGCPYLGDGACQMSPALRPYNCITFNCDPIENCLSGPDAAFLRDAEARLRELYMVLRQRAGFDDGPLLHRIEADGVAGIIFMRCS